MDPRFAPTPIRGGTTTLILGATALALALAAPPAQAAGNDVDAQLAASVHGKTKDKLTCASCHADLAGTAVPPAPGTKLQPATCTTGCHTDAAKKHPWHPKMEANPADIACQDCHGGHEAVAVEDPGFKFGRDKQAAACGNCHELMRDEFNASDHARALKEGVKEAPDCLACHRSELVTVNHGAPPVQKKRNQEKVCLACHLDSPEVRARVAPSAGFIGDYHKSVHGRALAAGNDKAPACADCHGSHEIKKGADGTSKVARQNIQEACAECHAEVAKAYKDSVHGAALAQGNSDSPTCTTCHGEHDILKHDDPASPVAAGNVSQKVCEPCHASLKLSKKYGIASDRFQTFEDSFHGLAIRGGVVEVANCASCHGAHDIKPSSDPTSRISQKNLVATCGKCHPGANERFTVGAVHVTDSPEHPVLWWIAMVYVTLIALVIGGMLAHNLLDFVKKTRHALAVRRGEIAEEPAPRRMYVRMTLGERLQHAALALSFIALVLTGFVLRYPEAWWVVWLRKLTPWISDNRALLHRVSAVVMLAATAWHLAYLVFARRGHQFLRDMVPRWLDVKQFVGIVLFNLGLRKERPRLGRFSYVEKAEYWALVWGTAVMTATGLVMWFDNTFMGILGKLGYDVSRTVHFYEAWLAALAIAVWHFYAVMFNPAVYPMNMSWWSGKLSEREMAEEHPAELDALKAADQPAATPETAAAGGDKPEDPPHQGPPSHKKAA